MPNGRVFTKTIEKRNGSRSSAPEQLPKAPTGISGLDEITGGGFPKGRPTLVCGSAGCGKTLLAMEFLVRGAIEYGEPGVFMAFEETAPELSQNVRSLGFDLDELVRKKLLIVDFVHVERNEIDETGDYDLEGLFIRLGAAIDQIGAKRVVLDTIETLFSGLQNEGILRAELRRLFRWLKDKGVSAVITGERGDGTLTRKGLEEYISDCVILLDHRVTDQLSTRRLRVVKYRGTAHGTNEYPFLIDEQGFSVLPVTSLGLQHAVSDERISTGVGRLDAMLGGEGLYRGSTVLISGTAGTGKTSLAAHMVNASCQRGEKCLHFSFEESPKQIMRNMRSIGLNLEQWVKKGLLQFSSNRATLHGLEMHLVNIHKQVQQFEPKLVVLDPISSLQQTSAANDANIMLVRLVDFLKMRGTTAVLTNLTHGGEALERTDADISSIVDTWLFVRDIEIGGERNRAFYVLKSRGMAHSNQLREFVLTDRGIDLLDVYLGPEGVLTGSARLSQEAAATAGAVERTQEAERKQRKREALDARIDALRKEFDAEEAELLLITGEENRREEVLDRDRQAMALSRGADKPQTAQKKASRN